MSKKKKEVQPIKPLVTQALTALEILKENQKQLDKLWSEFSSDLNCHLIETSLTFNPYK